MKKQFYLATAIVGALTAILIPLCIRLGGSVLTAATVTVSTTLYHLVMRLHIGYLVKAFFPKAINLSSVWFREHAWEKKVWRMFRVRKWAKSVPTFSPEEFDVSRLTLSQIARQTCLSELVHECIVVGGYFSLLFCFFFDDPLSNLLPFLITAILAGAYDMQFVILQRYNRPKILRLMKRTERRKRADGT